jgi:hypothetical protein
MVKKTRKRKCESCADPLVSCCDCDAKGIVLNYDEAQDCLSALSFFRREYENSSKFKAPETLKAMGKIENKLWKLKFCPAEPQRSGE